MAALTQRRRHESVGAVDTEVVEAVVVRHAISATDSAFRRLDSTPGSSAGSLRPARVRTETREPSISVPEDRSREPAAAADRERPRPAHEGDSSRYPRRLIGRHYGAARPRVTPVTSRTAVPPRPGGRGQAPPTSGRLLCSAQDVPFPGAPPGPHFPPRRAPSSPSYRHPGQALYMVGRKPLHMIRSHEIVSPSVSRYACCSMTKSPSGRFTVNR